MDQKTILGARIKAERERLRMSQVTFAEVGGVSKGSQIAYEQGRADVGAEYLVKVANIGLDLSYVLTGVRSISRPGMSAEEIDLFNEAVDAFWNLSQENRLKALDHMEYLGAIELRDKGETRGMRRPKRAEHPAEDATAGAATQNFHAPVSQVGGRDIINVGRKKR